MKLHTLAPNKGAKHRVKRLGCGESSGHGKTSCKGNKGQKARSGSGTRVGFEGGQMPLHRRLPKRGFNNVNFKTKVEVVNLAQIEKAFNDGDVVNEESLRVAGLINRACDQVKVLGHGDLTKKLSIVVDTISASAKEKVEKAGGSVATPVEA
ncbi:MAG: 50S ribosomal protein L15 [Verrucomicrobia bacterium]|nr:MAG: 50S ribosomal protein L15 [Verrucomicrobiota bacterium]TAE87980.1 MAG: 50S ribosomal protein L15 [Verrucomicrobiota bacterium]TAF26204.1 MAG: 50S ribosomal protein L15 [Verrucomicrobiota bacterium]TAF41759.1 MAG: 50S ribosomal protein L15 [Verrucomicrobiota bacterium]